MRGLRAPRRGPQLNDLGIIHDGSLLIRDGRLVEVGTTRRVENLAEARNALEINALGRVVMPGFVDSHTHLVFPPPGEAGDPEDLAADQAARALRTITGKRLAHCARGHLEAMARHGTTTVEAKTGCGPDESAETKVLRVLATLKRDPLDVIATFLWRLPPNGDGWAATEWVVAELLPKIRRRRWARFADLAWQDGEANARCFRRYFQAARSLGFACKIHADRSCPSAAIAMAREHSVVSIDHFGHSTPADAALLADSSTIVTLLPSAWWQSGQPGPAARGFLDAGAAIALASNFHPHHSPAMSMQTTVSLACLQMGMTPAEAISAATINGAYALGWGDRVGSLELGKAADLVILNVADYREIAQRFGTNLVHMTVKRGECIYKEGDVGCRAI